MILRLFFSTITTIFLFGRRVFAKGFPKSSGWDLYGRVPYDDWLFSTWTLSDPNLLKRSFVEAVSYYLYNEYVQSIWIFSFLSFD